MGHAGVKGRLNIVIYQRGSVFDLAISSEIKPGDLGGVMKNGTVIKPSAGGRIEGLGRE